MIEPLDPMPENRAMRFYSMAWWWLSHALKDDTYGFYVLVVAHSEANPRIPVSVVRHFAKRKRRRYIRELSAERLATEAPDGSLILGEFQPADSRWRFFGSPNFNRPMIAVSRTCKPDRSRLSPAVKQRVIERDEGICGICGCYVRAGEALDIDHILPLARGGTDDFDNLQVSHASCNRSKGARVPEGMA